jgi:hypothetical protein
VRFIRVRNSQQPPKAHRAGGAGRRKAAAARNRRGRNRLRLAIGEHDATTSAKAIAFMESTPWTWQVHSVFDVSGVACPASF